MSDLLNTNTNTNTNISISRHDKYKMTFDEWVSFKVPINDMFFNCSGTGKVDTDIYKWPLHGDPLINEPIGVSISITPEIINSCFDQIHMVNEDKGPVVNTKLFNCSFKVSNDNKRRGKSLVNRQNIKNTLESNGIKNVLLSPSVFLSDVVKSKFIISPEGNGVDTHRAWEALYFKGIPVIENNDDVKFKYDGLPVIFTDDYSDITPEFMERKFMEMRTQIFDFSPLFVSNYSSDVFDHIYRRSNHYGNKYQKIEWYPFDYSRISKYKTIYDDVCMITITNSGYKEVTKNALASLKKLNMKLNIEVFTLDDGCYKEFVDLGYNTTSLSSNLSMGSKFKDPNWANITLSKLNVISSVLDRYKYVFLFDGDIVFDSGEFLPYVYNEMLRDDGIDLVSQIEYYIDKKSLCSGFMMIKSSELTRHFFHPDRYSSDYDNDQDYLNKNRDKLKFVRLPLSLFPNGKYFYNEKPANPYIIHFNFVSGIPEKIKKIKNYNRWCIK